MTSGIALSVYELKKHKKSNIGLSCSLGYSVCLWPTCGPLRLSDMSASSIALLIISFVNRPFKRPFLNELSNKVNIFLSKLNFLFQNKKVVARATRATTLRPRLILSTRLL